MPPSIKERAQEVIEVASLAWLRTFGRTANDTFLCSYPKSGRTWLRFMISAYQVRLFQVNRTLTMANFAEVSPNLTFGRRMRLRTRMPHAGMVRIFGTHLPFRGLLQGARVIYLERDLRDVLVSYYHHRRARGEIPEGLDAFALSRLGLAPAIRYLESWRQGLRKMSPERACLLTYERLLTDPLGGLRRCIRFVGLPVDEPTLAAAVEDASAHRMRLLEETAGSYDFTVEQLRANPQARHVREARSGTHRGEMREETAASIESAVRRLPQLG